MQSNRTELDLDHSSNSISQWLLRLQQEKWWEETEAELENIRKINLVTRFISRIRKKVKQSHYSPDGSRESRFPDYMTTAQDGGKVVSLTHRPPLPPGNTPGTHFCWRLSRPQGHSAIGRILYQ